MEETLTIDKVNISPGERKRFEMVVAKLFDHTEMKMPIEVIRGKEDGPKIFISAAIHGDEINGVETIRRLLSYKKLLSKIRGTIIAAPIVNIFGFNRNLRYLPDRRDLNRVFPGSRNGSLASQIAFKFMNEVVKKCDYGIDLHTGSAHRYNLVQIRALLDDPEIKSLADSFGSPIIINSNVRDGSLRQAATDKKVKVLLFEGGEALRHNEEIIKSAEHGIFSTLFNIGMLDKKHLSTPLRRRQKKFYANSTYWIRAPHSGSVSIKKKIGSKVKKKEILAIIYDPLGIKKHYIKAKEDGLIIGIMMLPLVNNGDALFHIAIFDDVNIVEKAVEDYTNRFK